VKLNPFHTGRRGQSPRELRKENEALRTQVATLQSSVKEAVETAGWFNDRLKEEYARAEQATKRAEDAELVNDCLTKELETERRKVADLEAIAGPHVPAEETESPIFAEITTEHPLPEFTETYPEPDFSTDLDPEDTVQIPLVKPLADALAGAR
jgi:hypothetical protein